MKKLSCLLVFFILMGCDKKDVPDCIKATGNIVEKEIEVPFFDKVVVFDKVKLSIAQGDEQNVLIEAGENFIDEVKVIVEAGELRISEKNECNLFREYGTTKVHITVPNLRQIQNSSAGAVTSVGKLTFQELDLVSLNQERDSDIYTNGEFILDIENERINISSDNIAKFYLTGTTTNLYIGFYDGDGRLDASQLIAQNVNIFHRGSNKMIVNPQQSISGEIRSVGDVIALNEPPVVDVESFYTGRLIFE